MKHLKMTLKQITNLIVQDLNLRLNFVRTFNDVAYDVFDTEELKRIFLTRTDALDYISSEFNSGGLIIEELNGMIKVYRHELSTIPFIQYEKSEISDPLFGTKEFVKNSIKRKLFVANDNKISRLVEQATKIDKEIRETKIRTEKNQQKLAQWYLEDKK